MEETQGMKEARVAVALAESDLSEADIQCLFVAASYHANALETYSKSVGAGRTFKTYAKAGQVALQIRARESGAQEL